MSIERELANFLDNQIREHPSIDKSRTIEIITYFYGFGDSPWPTLEETGEQFSITRERVRQIKNKYFRSQVELSDLPSLKQFVEIVASRVYWRQSDLEVAIVASNVAGDNFSIIGLFNLTNDLDTYDDYEIYTPDLKEFSRSAIDKFEEYFIIKKFQVSKVKKLLKKAQGLPGRCGIARTKYLQNEQDYANYHTLICDLIKFSETAWTRDTEDGLWYLFEDRDNTLINYSEKVFSVIKETDAMMLAETYHKALHGRSHVYDYPPVELIANYLRSSRHLENIDDTLSFIGQVTHLNDIERDAAEYLGSKGSATYPELLAHLKSKGYKKPTADKAVFRSPFIYTDRSLGFKLSNYSLVGTLKVSQSEDEVAKERYKKFLRRLKRVGDTDETVEQKIRKEQAILRQWLFEGKERQDCAICGREYTVQALVAAHKKKRRDCNKAERLDPYIVMPVCVFGCDFLYENTYVVVNDGVVTNGLTLDNADVENEYIQKLIGKEVAKEWLKGQASYFHTLELPQ